MTLFVTLAADLLVWASLIALAAIAVLLALVALVLALDVWHAHGARRITLERLSDRIDAGLTFSRDRACTQARIGGDALDGMGSSSSALTRADLRRRGR